MVIIMSSPKVTFRLREARDRRTLTQAELAQRAGLQTSAISHFESGRRNPSFDNIRRLADALDVTTDYLLGRDDELKAMGPTVDRLFRDIEQMSSSDLDTLSSFAQVLAQKNKKGGSSKD